MLIVNNLDQICHFFLSSRHFILVSFWSTCKFITLLRQHGTLMFCEAVCANYEPREKWSVLVPLNALLYAVN